MKVKIPKIILRIWKTAKENQIPNLAQKQNLMKKTKYNNHQKAQTKHNKAGTQKIITILRIQKFQKNSKIKLFKQTIKNI